MSFSLLRELQPFFKECINASSTGETTLFERKMCITIFSGNGFDLQISFSMPFTTVNAMVEKHP